MVQEVQIVFKCDQVSQKFRHLQYFKKSQVEMPDKDLMVLLISFSIGGKSKMATTPGLPSSRLRDRLKRDDRG